MDGSDQPKDKATCRTAINNRLIGHGQGLQTVRFQAMSQSGATWKLYVCTSEFVYTEQSINIEAGSEMLSLCLQPPYLLD